MRKGGTLIFAVAIAVNLITLDPVRAQGACKKIVYYVLMTFCVSLADGTKKCDKKQVPKEKEVCDPKPSKPNSPSPNTLTPPSAK